MGLEPLPVRVPFLTGTGDLLESGGTRGRTLRKSAWDGHNREQGEKKGEPVRNKWEYLITWCPGEDSNLHGFRHWYLKPARLPIPPPGLGRKT